MVVTRIHTETQGHRKVQEAFRYQPLLKICILSSNVLFSAFLFCSAESDRLPAHASTATKQQTIWCWFLFTLGLLNCRRYLRMLACVVLTCEKNSLNRNVFLRPRYSHIRWICGQAAAVHRAASGIGGVLVRIRNIFSTLYRLATPIFPTRPQNTPNHTTCAALAFLYHSKIATLRNRPLKNLERP